ncbi:hypothetical protein JW865_00645 [Candidatus Bathyarchaeota archaeon]|nr:hypothetical protein [Candidatus Bathyarchaeota archaeon]
MTLNLDKLKNLILKWCPNPSTGFDINKSNLRFLKILPWISSTYVIRLFLIIFPFTVIIGLINGFDSYQRIFFNQLGLKPANYGVLLNVIQISRIILLPLVLFIISYFFGKYLDIKSEIKPLITYIFLGCFIGNFIGYWMTDRFMFHFLSLSGDLFLNIFSSIISSFPSAFIDCFVCFFAISVASIRNMNKNNFKTEDKKHVNNLGSSESNDC